MVTCFKKRSKIINSEIFDDKGLYIHLERRIKNIIKNRFQNKEINIHSSYIYQKMAVLLDSKIYMEARGIPKKYISPSGYINVFELHKRLTEIIMVWHIPERHKKIYTKEEKEYMRNILSVN